MKSISKNILVIGLLILVNLAIFLFCKLLTSEENYLWFKTTPDKELLVSVACLDLMRVYYFVYANGINFFLLGIYFAMYYRKTLGFIIAILSVGIFWGGIKLFQDNITDNYYTIFKNQAVQEDFILEPIKSAGYNIGPFIVQDVNAAYSPQRKHAIIGLGEIKYAPAADTLNTILHNLSERPEIRGESYIALLKMKTERSTSYARIFMGSIHPATDQEVMDYIKLKTIRPQ